MANNYTRGQETFFNRLKVTIENIYRLILISLILSIMVYLFIIYYTAPDEFWSMLSDFISYYKAHVNIRTFGSQTKLLALSITQLIAYHSQLFISMAGWAIAFGVCLISGSSVYFYNRGKKMVEHDVERGTKLLSTKEFSKEQYVSIQNEVDEIISDMRFPANIKARFTVRAKKFIGTPFQINNKGLWLASSFLYQHQAMLGDTGTGKSTLIKHYLDHCRKCNEKVIILDINGEYASEFKKHDDIILSLYDKRTEYWRFSGEKKINPSKFASFLVPEGGEQNKFFWLGARVVFAHLLENYTEEEIWNIVEDNDSSFVEHLDSLAAKIAGKEGSGQAAGVTGNTLLELSFLKDLNYWPKTFHDEKGSEEDIVINELKPFSVYDWAQNDDKRWIFITFSDSDLEITKPLIKVWFNSAILGLIQRKLQSVKNLPPVNFVCDELASVGQLDMLGVLLARGRKYGGKATLGYQVDNQITAMFGKEKGEAIKDQIGTKYIFRTKGTNSAKELSDYLCSQEVRQKSTSQSYGTRDFNDRENLNESPNLRKVVLDSEIKKLPNGHFYLSCLNIDPVKSRVTKKKWQQVDGPHEEYHGYPPTSKPYLQKPTTPKGDNMKQDLSEQKKEQGGVKGKKLQENALNEENDGFDQTDEEFDIDL